MFIIVNEVVFYIYRMLVWMRMTLIAHPVFGGTVWEPLVGVALVQVCHWGKERLRFQEPKSGLVCFLGLMVFDST